MNATAEATGVGRMLRQWRTERRISQLDLANQAEVSTRHLSFIETGRARPSRQMVLVLSSALEVPLRERNSLLMAAGYAPAYRETALESPEMADGSRCGEGQVHAATIAQLRPAAPLPPR